MFPRDITNSDRLVVYLVDCTLATVCDMAMKKRRPKYEYERQISIAQRAISLMHEMRIDPMDTRAKEIMDNTMIVAEWARKYEV